MSEAILDIAGSQLRITAPDDDQLRAEALRISKLPELNFPNATMPQIARLGLGFFTTLDTNSRLDIVQKILPDAKIIRFGDNAIIDHQGTQTLLNRPGISLKEPGDIAASMVKFLPSAKAAQLTKAFYGLFPAAFIGGVTAAGTSAVEDVAAGAQGSQQGVIPGKVATDFVLGAGSEMLAPAVGRAFRFVKSLFSTPQAVVNRQLTKDAVARIEAEGLDIASVRQALTDLVEREGPDALAAPADDIAAALRAAEAEQVGVDLTRGQATRDFKQLSLEDTLRSSDVTSRAGQTLREFDELQRRQLAEAGRGVQDVAAGGARRGEGVEEVGDLLLQSLRSEHQAARQAVDQAYAAARQFDGSFSLDSVIDMGRAVRRSLVDPETGIKEIIAPDLHPNASKMLERIDGLVRQVRTITRKESASAGRQTPAQRQFQQNIENVSERIARGDAPEFDTPLGRQFQEQLRQTAQSRPGFRAKRQTIAQAEFLRRQLGNLANNATRDDARLATRIMRGFDQWLDEAIDTAAFSGDDQALEALRQARAARASQGARFERRSKWDTAGSIVENLLNKDVTGTETVNYIFGANAVNRQGARATVRRLREILPPEQFNLVREGAWLRTIEKAYKGGTFSRAKALSAIDDFLDGKGKAVANELFSPQERNQLRRFRRVIANTTTPKEATGPSGTPRKLAQMFQQLMSVLGFASAATGNPVAAATLFSVKTGKPMMDFRKARRAVRGFELSPGVSVAAPAATIAVGREFRDDSAEPRNVPGVPPATLPQ